MQNLRALRVAAGKKQSEMAEIMGVERSTYVKWETGRNLVDVGTLVRLADYFNVTTDYILDMEPKGADDEIWELREELRRNPDLNVLLSMAKGATREDIIKTVKMLKVMKGDDT